MLVKTSAVVGRVVGMIPARLKSALTASAAATMVVSISVVMRSAKAVP